MAGSQKRWLCGECHRQWQYARILVPGAISLPWQPGMVCPACGSEQVRQVEYVAEFAGGDIPLEDPNAKMRIMPNEAPLVPPEENPYEVTNVNHTMEMSASV